MVIPRFVFLAFSLVLAKDDSCEESSDHISILQKTQIAGLHRRAAAVVTADEEEILAAEEDFERVTSGKGEKSGEVEKSTCKKKQNLVCLEKDSDNLLASYKEKRDDWKTKQAAATKALVAAGAAAADAALAVTAEGLKVKAVKAEELMTKVEVQYSQTLDTLTLAYQDKLVDLATASAEARDKIKVKWTAAHERGKALHKETKERLALLVSDLEKVAAELTKLYDETLEPAAKEASKQLLEKVGEWTSATEKAASETLAAALAVAEANALKGAEKLSEVAQEMQNFKAAAQEKIFLVADTVRLQRRKAAEALAKSKEKAKDVLEGLAQEFNTRAQEFEDLKDEIEGELNSRAALAKTKYEEMETTFVANIDRMKDEFNTLRTSALAVKEAVTDDMKAKYALVEQWTKDLTGRLATASADLQILVMKEMETRKQIVNSIAKETERVLADAKQSVDEAIKNNIAQLEKNVQAAKEQVKKVQDDFDKAQAQANKLAQEWKEIAGKTIEQTKDIIDSAVSDVKTLFKDSLKELSDSWKDLIKNLFGGGR